MEFTPFPKISRLSRECVISEKIDGTNAQIFISPRSLLKQEELDNPTIPFLSVTSAGHTDYIMLAGSRNRWISEEDDNYGFGRWVSDNRNELVRLGPGRHFGEWWGAGIQRRYGLTEKRFSLFNTLRWANPETSERPPACCSVVPELYRGLFDTSAINEVLNSLAEKGSVAAPGFMHPEGIIVYHLASKTLFKKTMLDDGAKSALVVS